MEGDEKGPVSFKMAYLKGRIKDAQWDRYLPLYMKKSHNETEMLCWLYISKGNCSALTLCCSC